jgi:isoquinoline 1-oxidoreductase beta subunit
MVYAGAFTAANRAADLVKVKWQLDQTANVSEQDIQQHAAELIADPKGGSLFVDDPGVDAALASSKRKIERTYTTATVMHFALEPGQRPGLRKGRPRGNSHRQSMAVVDPAGSRESFATQ